MKLAEMPLDREVILKEDVKKILWPRHKAELQQHLGMMKTYLELMTSLTNLFTQYDIRHYFSIHPSLICSH